MNRSLNPRLVLALAILFPGAGHVAIGQTQRGFCFALFAILFMVLSYLTTTSGALVHRTTCWRAFRLGAFDHRCLSIGKNPL